jgi:hypothetical protein
LNPRPPRALITHAESLIELPLYCLAGAAAVQLFTSDGIPIEPFHLRRERAEGFFDGEGNYVEYRLEPVSDAWLDSLGVSLHGGGGGGVERMGTAR